MRDVRTDQFLTDLGVDVIFFHHTSVMGSMVLNSYDTIVSYRKDAVRQFKQRVLLDDGFLEKDYSTAHDRTQRLTSYVIDPTPFVVLRET